jgi:hypothetical protein
MFGLTCITFELTSPKGVGSMEWLGFIQRKGSGMKWVDAVEAMKAGKHVRRASESKRTLLQPRDDLTTPVYDCGISPAFLAAAWTEDEAPVRVFMDSWSKTLFVPDDEHRTATDWMVVDP